MSLFSEWPARPRFRGIRGRSCASLKRRQAGRKAQLTANPSRAPPKLPPADDRGQARIVEIADSCLTPFAANRAARDASLVDAPRTLADVDWARWTGVLCTLVFVVRGGEVLLIRKKRGLGAGKVNGPGGRFEPDESPLACAVREVREEVCAVPRGLSWCGRNRFHFTDGYATDVHVFRASALDGEPAATAEADPFWSPIEKVPYAEMWADDSLWLPHVFAGRRFSGRFLFEGDALLDWALEL
jgi:8-oxo-dGTP diphosphatase